MTIYAIPLQPVPSQKIVVDLAGQSATIILRQIVGRQFLSMSISGQTICENVLLVDRSAVVRAPYTGFSGELMSVDTEGTDAPSFTGWGTRFFLLYSDTGFNDGN